MTEPEKKNGKQTPGRQRHGQNSANRSANRRNYASENDVARNDPSVHAELMPKARNQGGGGGGGRGGPSTPQKTPRKSHKAASTAKSPTPASGAPGTVNHNKRNKSSNKSQPNNLSGSPAVAAAKFAGSRRTPPPPPAGRPVATGSATPASTAFAGATFHASPAPSSLPLPSFFTKKSPGTPSAEVSNAKRGLRQQPSPPASDSEVPSSMATGAGGKNDGGAAPSSVVPASALGLGQQSETPLEALFRADRAEKAEKERIRRASSANIGGTGVTPAPFSPPAAPVHMQFDYGSSNTFPRGPAQQQHQHYLLTQQQQTARRPGPATRSSSSGISAAELDGTPGQPLGPSFATSFQERMRAVRSSSSRMSESTVSGSPYNNQPGFRDAPSSTGPMPFPQANYDQPLSGADFGVEGRKDARSEALLRFVQNSVPGTAAAAAPGGQHPSPAVFNRQPFPPMASAQSNGYPRQNAPPPLSGPASSCPLALTNHPSQPFMNASAGGPVNNQPFRMDNLVRSWINRSASYEPGAPPPPSL